MQKIVTKYRAYRKKQHKFKIHELCLTRILAVLSCPDSSRWATSLFSCLNCASFLFFNNFIRDTASLSDVLLKKTTIQLFNLLPKELILLVLTVWLPKRKKQKKIDILKLKFRVQYKQITRGN